MLVKILRTMYINIGRQNRDNRYRFHYDYVTVNHAVLVLVETLVRNK